MPVIVASTAGSLRAARMACRAGVAVPFRKAQPRQAPDDLQEPRIGK